MIVHPARIVVDVREARRAHANLSQAHATSEQVGELEVPTDLESARLSIWVSGHEIGCMAVHASTWHQGMQWLAIAPRLSEDEDSMRQLLGLTAHEKYGSRRYYMFVNLESELRTLLPYHALQQIIVITGSQDADALPFCSPLLLAQHKFTELMLRLIAPPAHHSGDHHFV